MTTVLKNKWMLAPIFPLRHHFEFVKFAKIGQVQKTSLVTRKNAKSKKVYFTIRCVTNKCVTLRIRGKGCGGGVTREMGRKTRDGWGRGQRGRRCRMEKREPDAGIAVGTLQPYPARAGSSTHTSTGSFFSCLVRKSCLVHLSRYFGTMTLWVVPP